MPVLGEHLREGFLLELQHQSVSRRSIIIPTPSAPFHPRHSPKPPGSGAEHSTPRRRPLRARPEPAAMHSEAFPSCLVDARAVGLADLGDGRLQRRGQGRSSSLSGALDLFQLAQDLPAEAADRAFLSRLRGVRAELAEELPPCEGDRHTERERLGRAAGGRPASASSRTPLSSESGVAWRDVASRARGVGAGRRPPPRAMPRLLAGRDEDGRLAGGGEDGVAARAACRWCRMLRVDVTKYGHRSWASRC